MAILSSSPSDARLVRRALAGNTDEFNRLVERYYPAVKAVAHAHLRRPEDVEDAVQDSFLKAFKSLATLRDGSKFAGWLIVITRNTCLQLRKRAARRDTSELAAPVEGRVEPQVEQREIRDLLHRQIAALDDDTRELLYLFYFSRKPVREIAVMLGISNAAAKKRLQRARDTLGAHMLDQLDPPDRQQGDSEGARRVMAIVAAAPAVRKSAQGALRPASMASWPVSIVAALAVAALAGGVWFFNRTTNDDGQSIHKEIDDSGVSVRPSDAVSEASVVARVSEGTTRAVSDRPTPVVQEVESADEEEPQPAPEWVNVSGTVFDNNGNPVAGARVVARPLRMFFTELLLDMNNDGTREQAKFAAEAFSGEVDGDTVVTTSAPDGTFSLDLSIVNSTVSITVEKPGFVGIDNRRINLEDQDLPGLAFILEYGASVGGVVTDAAGNPLKDIQVAIREPSEDGWSYQPGPVVTNETGRFEFADVSPGEYQVYVFPQGRTNMPDHPHYAIGLAEGETLENVNLVYDQGRIISGRLVDREDNPVRGFVTAGEYVQEGDHAHSVHGMYTYSEVYTGDDGEFVLEGLEDRDYIVYARVDGSFGGDEGWVDNHTTNVRAGAENVEFIFDVPERSANEFEWVLSLGNQDGASVWFTQHGAEPMARFLTNGGNLSALEVQTLPEE